MVLCITLVNFNSVPHGLVLISCSIPINTDFRGMPPFHVPSPVTIVPGSLDLAMDPGHKQS